MDWNLSIVASELALLAAEEALQRGGRKGIQVTLAGAGGTDWIRVPRTATLPVRETGQLRLF